MKIILTLFFIILSICSSINISGQNKKFDSLIFELKKAKHDTTRCNIYLDIGNLFEYESPDSAILYYQKAYDLADKYFMTDTENNRHGNKDIIRNFALYKANSLLYIGIIHFYKGRYDKAIEFYLKSLNIMEKIQDKMGMAYCIENIGIVYLLQGNYSKSIEYYSESLKIKEEIQDIKGMSQCYNNIGLAHYYIGCTATGETAKISYAGAIEYFFKALDLFEKLANKPAFINGVPHTEIEKEEIFWGKKGMTQCCNNIGLVYFHYGNYDKAIKFYQKSLNIAEGLQDMNQEAEVYGNIASLHIAMADSLTQRGEQERSSMTGHLRDAIEYGNKAMTIAREIKSASLIYKVAEVLQNAYKELGNFKKALEYAEIFIETKDTLFCEEKTKALAEMGAKYEAEKKQLQIENLNKENALKKAELAQSEEKRGKQLALIYSFVIGFIIILVFSFVTFRMFMQKKKANRILAHQNLQIEIQNSRLNQANEEITAQRDEIAVQRDLVIQQKEHIEEQKKEITDSINYAKRIQTAVLPTGEYANKILREHFILFKPKDIVSGDFYWATRINEWLIVTVADCTGHGVPGAFMSMLGVSFLNEIVRKKEIIKASDVLDQLRSSIIEALQQKGSDKDQKDGMDISLIAINQCADVPISQLDDSNKTNCQISKSNNQLIYHAQWAGANNPLYVIARNEITKQSISGITSPSVRNDEIELHELKGDKMPIAIYERIDSFTNHELQLFSGDTIYLMSDGYQDQFGGHKHKKFLSKNLKQLLIENCRLSMNEQKEILNSTFEKWRGENEQIDDVTILGLRI